MMKILTNYVVLLGLFFNSGYLNAQSNDFKANTYIDGHVINRKGVPGLAIVKTFAPDFTEFDEKVKTDSFPVSAIGEFQVRLNLSVTKSVVLTFRLADTSFYFLLDPMFRGHPGFFIEPGDSIRLDIKSYNFSGIEVKGRGAEKIKCIRDIYDKAEQVSDRDIFKTHGREKGRLIYNNIIRKQSIDIVNAYKPLVSKLAYNVLLGDFVLGHLHYWTFSELFMRKGVSDSIKVEYQKTMAALPLYLDLRDTLLKYNSTSQYGRYVEFIFLSRRLNKSNRIYDASKEFPISYAERYDIAHDSIKGVLGEKVLFGFLSSRLTGTRPLDPAFNKFTQRFLSGTSNRSPYHQEIAGIVERAKLLKRGKQAYEFILRDTLDQMHRMSSFRGKVVVMDFMFYPCGGCFQISPYLETLCQKYKGLDVQFVSISTDPTKAVWKMGIGKCSAPSSLQLNTNGLTQNHPVVKFYQVSSYPTLVLIDKKGKIISARAPDPRLDDGKALIAEIDKALSQN